MAKILLLSTHAEDPRDNSFKRGAYTRLKQSADLGQSRHRLVEDPVEADIILFAEIAINFGFYACRHPYYKSFREKCFAFGADDYPVPFLPGVYASVEKKYYSPRRVRSGLYLSILENPHTHMESTPVERDLLYSFVGSVDTWPIRSVLEQLRHPRSVFIDTSRESLPILSAGTPEQREVFWKKYADIARRSKFVLCPRGRSPASIRLFEMMRMGRAPVILSDDWVPPQGPRWNQFSVMVPESESKNVPHILEERESEAIALGLKAREEWERWFSPQAIFDTVADWCLEIKESRRVPEFLAQLLVYPQIFRRPLLGMYVREWRNLLAQESHGQK